MTSVTGLQNERTQLFRDLLSGKIPKRVPVSASMGVEFCIEYAGMNLAETLWDTAKFEQVFEKTCSDFFSDSFPATALRIPSWYQILGSKPIVMSSSGLMQHPEVEGLLPEEYDYFIAAPYDCIIEKILPRLFPELATDNPHQNALVLAKAMRAHQDEMANVGMLRGKMAAKYGYSAIPTPQAFGFTAAPYDFIADFLRGFKGISKDIKRIPDKVVAACEAVTPLMIKKGLPPAPSLVEGFTFIPLHMAPYMREKDFEKFYWPTFKELLEALHQAGQGIYLFVEHDWTRFLDYLYELPENTLMRIEFGDPKLFKEKLGKKHILAGFYPITLLQTGTKEQCIDKAKELLDILAPGGRFWFIPDKSLLAMDKAGKIATNLIAVNQYVYENGAY